VRRQLLTEDERRLLFGVPQEADALTRHYSFARSDQALLAERRGDANRLGFAVQLALLRHPGIALAHMEQPVGALVAWLSERLEIPVADFTKYAGRAQRP
jgi:TnpA family transposase